MASRLPFPPNGKEQRNQLASGKRRWMTHRAWLAMLFLASSVQAQDIDPEVRRTALEMAASGDALYAAGDYVSALARFTRAAELVSAPTLMLRKGDCLEKLGRLVEAVESYRRASAFPIQENATEPFRQAVATARTRFVAVEARVAHLLLTVLASNADSVLVTLNDAPLSASQWQSEMALDPGQYRIQAALDGRLALAVVTLGEGSRQETTLRLLPTPSDVQRHGAVATLSAPHAERFDVKAHNNTYAWIALGVGGVGALTGLVSGIEVLRLQSKLDRNGCVDTVCRASQSDDVQTYNSLRNVSTAGFIVGGVGLAVGGALIYLSPRTGHARGENLTPWLGIGSAGISSAF